MSYTVAVRALCEFAAREGDLDLRFAPSPSGPEGVAGHAAVAARRGPGYQTEVTLEGRHGSLLVRGRADGYDSAQGLLEEIKTYRGSAERIPASQQRLHRAQLHVYGHLLCQREQLPRLDLALVYFEIGRGEETVLRETRSAAELAAQFTALCERFVAWAEQEAQHRSARDAALAQLRFPHAAFRPGQRQLAQAVYQANAGGRCLLAQAPTGIGKTLGTLFPALKAMPDQGIDKLFFLAAKTPGRQLALGAAATLARDGQPLRVLELVARDKACVHPDKACHAEACPLARGFYDRLPAAREAARAIAHLDSAAVRAVAQAHAICPYYLSTEMARWSDVVVGDYNYYFDGSALLHGLAANHQWRVSVLVDEAHNLVARTRSMYSASLRRAALRAVRPLAPRAARTALTRADRLWRVLEQEHAGPWGALDAPPAALLNALQGATAAITEHLAEQGGALAPELQRVYFDCQHLLRLADSFGAHMLCDLTRNGPHDSALALRNVVPAPYLKSRFALAHAATLFSATLSPWHYHADLLGLPDNTGWIEVDSPFHASQLQVRVASGISTSFQRRAGSAAPIAALIARQYAERPGNYLAFFSSFDYLDMVADALAARYPAVPRWRQTRQMHEDERAAFLARFTPDGRGVGFAVLGGAFAEGVDLPGERLIGAFVATLGLPQFNPVNEALKERMDGAFGAGYEYTYLYPGLQKVVQAAGRVIRSESDRGVLHLIDSRYGTPAVQALLPRWWRIDAAA